MKDSQKTEVRVETGQPVLMAACVSFDGRSRLRGRVRGTSERFHAISERGAWFACDSMNHSPGRKQPAHTVAAELRCRRAACASLFARADATTTGCIPHSTTFKP